MTELGTVVVAELCEAAADVIDSDPRGAAKVARRLATSIRSHMAASDDQGERELKIREAYAARGKRPF
jgi:hypothetical protein